MTVILLGHAVIAPFKNPIDADYDRYVPDLHAKTWAVTSRWADMICFMDYYVVVEDDGSRKKGRGGNERVMHFENSAAYDSKNRYGLPSELEMGESGEAAYATLRNAITEARKET